MALPISVLSLKNIDITFQAFFFLHIKKMRVYSLVNWKNQSRTGNIYYHKGSKIT